MKIKDTIKDQRVKKELTQDGLASALEVSKKTISNWENGKSTPDLESILKLSNIFEISLDELIKGNNEVITQVKKDKQIVKQSKLTLLILSLLGVCYSVILFIKWQNLMPQITDPFINGIFIIFLVGVIIWQAIQYIKIDFQISLLFNICLSLLIIIIIYSISSHFEPNISLDWQRALTRISGTFVVAISIYGIFNKPTKSNND